MGIVRTIASYRWRNLALLIAIALMSISFIDARQYRRPARRRIQPRHRVIRRQPIVNNVKFTQTLSHFFSKQELAASLTKQNEQELVWTENQTNPFRELIISWNALRPEEGSFKIWVRVKVEGKWTPWQILARWGDDHQRTFGNRSNQLARAKYSHIATMRRLLARGFQVKVTCHDGAKSSSVKALFACMSRPNLMRIGPSRSTMPSVLVKDVPQQSQILLPKDKYKICSPTSVSMIVAYFYQKLYGQKIAGSLSEFAASMAEQVYDQALGTYGNWILSVAQAFDSLDGGVFFCVERMNNFNELYSCLTKKIPVAVSVRRLNGGAFPYSGGHLLVVVGWNQKRQCVLCIDPAFQNNQATLRAYPLRSFLQAWSRSCNLAYRPIVPGTMTTA